MMITGPWLFVAMAREGVFFETLGRLHPTRGVPSIALIAQASVTLFYVFAGRLAFLVEAVVFVEWIFHGLVAWALIRLVRSHPAHPRPYASPLFPLAPVVYLVAAVLVVGSTVWQSDASVRLTGVAVVASGALVYGVWRRAR